jgi:hypothetical protein
MKHKKPSWQYLWLAKRIQTGSRHYVAKLVLLHLADSADDNGISWHGHKSIAAYCSASRSAIQYALTYLRDELHVVTWKHGSGGASKKDTNTYRLDLQALQSLIADQGVFDPKTGKLIRSVEPNDEDQSSPMTGRESSPMTAHSVEPNERAVEPNEAPVEPNEALSRALSLGTNPYEPPLTNPQLEPPRPGPLFSGESSALVSSEVVSVVTEADRLPPIPSPPQAGGVHVTWGDPIPGFRFRRGDDPGYVNLKTGRLMGFEDAQRLAQKEMN